MEEKLGLGDKADGWGRRAQREIPFNWSCGTTSGELVGQLMLLNSRLDSSSALILSRDVR